MGWLAGEVEMSDPNQSIFNEPHLQSAAYPLDPSERLADQVTAGPDAQSANPAHDSVWNEPNAAGLLTSGQSTPYAQWLLDGQQQTSGVASWLRLFGLAVIAGPVAIVTAFWGGGQTAFSVLALTVFGPVVEEMGKILCLLTTVELRPFWFVSRSQILAGGLIAGLAFAAIENLIYFNLYFPEPEPWLVVWRWTVCVALHTSCSLLASVGVARIWSDVFARRQPPRVELGVPFWCAAMVVHGLYNFTMILAEFWIRH